MKKILFLLLLMPCHLFSQDSTTYTFRLDTFGVDSLFLVETVSTPQPGKPRPIETEYHTFFSDTAQLTAHIASMLSEYDVLTAQVAEISRRKAAWDYRYNRVLCLRDSVFYGASCTGVGSRTVKAPPIGVYATCDTMVHSATEGTLIFVENPGGFWVQYTSGTVEWVEHIGKVKKNVSFTVLGRDGTKTKFLKPKKSAKKNK